MSEKQSNYTVEARDALEMIGAAAPREIVTEISGFYPIFEVVLEKTGDLLTAAVHGVMWRFCQMEDNVCKVPLDKIASILGISTATVMRRQADLVAMEYFRDLTPGLKNKPHIYVDNQIVVMKNQLSASSHFTVKRDISQGNVHVSQSQLNKDINKDSNKEVHGAQKNQKPTAQIIQEANKKMDAILEQERKTVEALASGKGWRGRESLPEQLWPLADKCQRAFGTPPKRDLTGWLMELGDWLREGITGDDFDRAIELTKSWSTPPVSPMSLSRTIRTVLARRTNGANNANYQTNTQPRYTPGQLAQAERVKARKLERRQQALSGV